VLPGDGTGTFSGQTMIQIGVSPVAMAVDDFNGDGKADIAVALSAAGAAVTLNTTAP
jgi:FG-GAP-like repeat